MRADVPVSCDALNMCSALTRPDPQQGGEPLGDGRSLDMLALVQAAEAAASAQLAPMLQMEWETSVDWCQHKPRTSQPASSLSLEEHETGSIPGVEQTLREGSQPSLAAGLHTCLRHSRS